MADDYGVGGAIGTAVGVGITVGMANMVLKKSKKLLGGDKYGRIRNSKGFTKFRY